MSDYIFLIGIQIPYLFIYNLLETSEVVLKGNFILKSIQICVSDCLRFWKDLHLERSQKVSRILPKKKKDIFMDV